MQVFRRVSFGLLLVLLIAGAVWFGWRNHAPAQVDLLFGAPLEFPLWVWLFGMLALGALAAALALLPALLRASFALRHARRALRELESEVHQLRNLPLEGADAVSGAHARAGVGKENA